MAILATTAAFGFDADPVRLLTAYRALGCTACQYYRNRERAPAVSVVQQAVKAAGVPLDSTHGLFGEDLDPSSPDHDHRQYCIKTYANEAKLALQLGVSMVVIHPAGLNPGKRVMTPAEAAESQAARWPKFQGVLRALAEVGETLSVTFLVENLPYNCPLGHDPVALARSVLLVDSSRLRMCFDTGHAHIAAGHPGLRETIPPVHEALRLCAPAISYLHFHDNDTTADDHKVPGEGTIDWENVAGVLRDAKIDAPRMLELFLPETAIEALARATAGPELKRKLAID